MSTNVAARTPAARVALEAPAAARPRALARPLVALALAMMLLLPVACRDAGDPPADAPAEATTVGESDAGAPEAPTEAPGPTEVDDEGGMLGAAGVVAAIDAALAAGDATLLEPFAAQEMAIGAWRSEWRATDPAGAVEELARWMPAEGGAVVVAEPGEALEADMDGMDPFQMLGPDTPVTAVRHASGLGEEGVTEALLFVTTGDDGVARWKALLYAPEGFALP